MPNVIIDGKEIEIPSGVRLNAIQAAKAPGSRFRYYCWHPGLPVVGSCRMCLVETGRRDAATGNVVMNPNLTPGCNTVVSDGMVIVTESEKVRAARAMVKEDLLLRHPSTARSATRRANACCKIITFSMARTPGGRTSAPSPAGGTTWAISRSLSIAACCAAAAYALQTK